MYRLIIDTSTTIYYLCLTKDNKIIKEIKHSANKNHAPFSVIFIDELLKENNITINDIEEVICGIGPGSYTGVRIALTIAKMICSFKNIPLKTISTLYLMSSGYDNAVALIDAKRGNYFSACYSTPYLEDKLRTKEELDQYTKNIQIVTDENFKVDIVKVINNSKLEEKVDEVVPNYLRITEAEYNLKNNNDKKM